MEGGAAVCKIHIEIEQAASDDMMSINDLRHAIFKKITEKLSVERLPTALFGEEFQITDDDQSGGRSSQRDISSSFIGQETRSTKTFSALVRKRLQGRLTQSLSETKG